MILYEPDTTDNESWNNTTFNGGIIPRLDQIVKDIKNTNINFNNKKILCLGGGIGRNADQLRQFGCQVTNSDIQKKYVTLGKSLYPNIEHIEYDYEQSPLEGYDYVVIENFWGNRCCWRNTIELANKWKNTSEIIPNSYEYKIYKFDSDVISTYYKQKEKIGNIFVQDKLQKGVIEGKICKRDVQNLEVETVFLNLQNPILEIDTCDTHEYQVLGFDIIGLPNLFRGLFVNNGVNLKFV